MYGAIDPVPLEALLSAPPSKNRRPLRLLLIVTVCLVGFVLGSRYQDWTEGETWTRWRNTDLVIATRREAPVLITHLEAVYAVQQPGTSRSVLGIAPFTPPLLISHQGRCILTQAQWQALHWADAQGEPLPAPAPGSIINAVYTEASVSHYFYPWDK